MGSKHHSAEYGKVWVTFCENRPGVAFCCRLSVVGTVKVNSCQLIGTPQDTMDVNLTLCEIPTILPTDIPELVSTHSPVVMAKRALA